MPTIRDIATTIEGIAPLSLQESYDNSGLQIGSPDTQVNSVMVCLTVTEEILAEARSKGCELIVSHHPLLFKGLKHISDKTSTERIVTEAIRHNIALYAAHTNLDASKEGVSVDMAQALGMTEIKPLQPTGDNSIEGLGVIGAMPNPVPALEFLRHVKKIFGVKNIRYSATTPTIVIRKVALCGGAGGSLIEKAIKKGADAYVTGDLRYHDYDSFGHEILLADIGHYESELGARKLLGRLIRDAYPDVVIMTAESEINPIETLS